MIVEIYDGSVIQSDLSKIINSFKSQLDTNGDPIIGESEMILLDIIHHLVQTETITQQGYDFIGRELEKFSEYNYTEDELNDSLSWHRINRYNDDNEIVNNITAFDGTDVGESFENNNVDLSNLFEEFNNLPS